VLYDPFFVLSGSICFAFHSFCHCSLFSFFKLSTIIHCPHRFFMPAIPAILHQQQNNKDMSEAGKQQEEMKKKK